jgi:hypothetical protein
MGSLVLMIIDFIAAVDPTLVFKHISAIASGSATVQSGDIYYTKIVGKIAFATIPNQNAADVSFDLLLTLLDKKNIESTVIAMILHEISNIMSSLSDLKVLVNAMPRLVKYRGASEVTYCSIGKCLCVGLFFWLHLFCSVLCILFLSCHSFLWNHMLRLFKFNILPLSLSIVILLIRTDMCHLFCQIIVDVALYIHINSLHIFPFFRRFRLWSLPHNFIRQSERTGQKGQSAQQ